jgi:hypothetical protein
MIDCVEKLRAQKMRAKRRQRDVDRLGERAALQTDVSRSCVQGRVELTELGPERACDEVDRERDPRVDCVQLPDPIDRRPRLCGG